MERHDKLHEAIRYIERERDTALSEKVALEGIVEGLEAQRDRYRAALAEIAALPRPQLQSERTWREVALEALRDG